MLVYYGLDHINTTSSLAVAYPELVSRGVSERRKCKWLLRVGASNGATRRLKKIMVGGGGSGQPEKKPGYATD